LSIKQTSYCGWHAQPVTRALSAGAAVWPNQPANLLNLKHPVGHVVVRARVRHVIHEENTLAKHGRKIWVLAWHGVSRGFASRLACAPCSKNYGGGRQSDLLSLATHLCTAQIRPGDCLKSFTASCVPDLQPQWHDGDIVDPIAPKPHEPQEGAYTHRPTCSHAHARKQHMHRQPH